MLGNKLSTIDLPMVTEFLTLIYMLANNLGEVIVVSGLDMHA